MDEEAGVDSTTGVADGVAEGAEVRPGVELGLVGSSKRPVRR